jgi:poly(A) polymerase
LLLIQIERYSHETILAHPYPRDFLDKSRPLHCFYFIGLWRKQTAQAQEAEQFDIRGIVNEFKSNIYAYQHWKEGMDIEVSHVKRREIPLFVFPGGVRPPRSFRTAHKNSRTVPACDVSAGQVENLLCRVSCSDAQPVACKGSYTKQPEPDNGRFQFPGSTSVLPSSLPNKEALNGHAKCQAESVEHEHIEHYQESTFAPAVQNNVCNAVKQHNILLPISNNGWQSYGPGSSLNSSQRECVDSAANNLPSLPPAILAEPDELDQLVSYHQVKANQVDINADWRPSLEGSSEDNLEQPCSLRPQNSNDLKRKANEELEVLSFLTEYFQNGLE